MRSTVPNTPTPVTEFPFPRAVAALWHNEASGSLTISRHNIHKVILVVEGTPVFAESNKVEESLSAYLVGRGQLSEKAAYGAVAKSVATGRDVGDILVQMGLLQPNDLLTAMRRCSGACILDAFRWKNGELSFDANLPDVSDRISLKMSPPALVLRGVSAFLSMDQIAGDIEFGPQQRFQLRPGLLEEIPDLNLNTVERRVVEALWRPRTISELVESAVISDELAVRLLYALSVLELVADPETVATERAKGAEIAVPAPPPPVPKEDLLNDDERAIIDNAYYACKMRDHFEWLNVGRNVSYAELRQAFLAMCKELSPGSFKGKVLGEYGERLESAFLGLVDAFNTLADTPRRETYLEEIDRRARIRAAKQKNKPKLEFQSGRLEADTLLRAGAGLAADGKHAEALKFFEQILEAEPLHTEALARSGHSLYMSSPTTIQRSVQFLQQAMAVEPEWGGSFFYLGHIYEVSGEKDLAIQAYSECLRLDPGHEQASAGMNRLG